MILVFNISEESDIYGWFEPEHTETFAGRSAAIQNYCATLAPGQYTLGITSIDGDRVSLAIEKVTVPPAPEVIREKVRSL